MQEIYGKCLLPPKGYKIGNIQVFYTRYDIIKQKTANGI